MARGRAGRFVVLTFLVCLAILPSTNAVVPIPGCVENFYQYFPPEASSAGGLWGFGNDDIFVSSFPTGGTGNTLIYHWDGVTLTNSFTVAKSTFASRQLFGIDNTHVWIVGGGGTSGGGYFYNGASWTLSNLALGVGVTFQDIHGTSNSNIWAVASGGGAANDARVRFWNGASWSKVTVVESVDLERVHVFSPASVVITGLTAGYVAEYDGVSWTDISVPESTRVSGIWGTSANDFWVAVGANTGFYHRVNGVWSSKYLLTTAFRIDGEGPSIFTVSGPKIAQYKSGIDAWEVVADHTGDSANGAPIGYDRVWLSSNRVHASARGTNGGTFTNGFEAWNCYPLSDAGPDQTNVDEGDIVQLNGCESLDPDATPIVYTWTQTSGPSVILSNPSTCNPSFTMPELVDGDQLVTFSLDVSDTDLNSVTDDAVTVGRFCSSSSNVESTQDSILSFIPPVFFTMLALGTFEVVAIKAKGGSGKRRRR